MITTAAKTAVDLAIDDAAEILEDCYDIALFVLDRHEDAEIAWSALAKEHGERIAVAEQRGNKLIISWHSDHKPIAWRIRCAFRAVGLRATWDGEVWNAVHVDLTLRRPHN